MPEILDITTLTGFTIRLAMAIILGFLIGLERQWNRHNGGMHTNMIVCAGAYAFSSVSYLAITDGTDPTRIASQVVCGIGFLGAGLIIRDGTNILGLSTAATIWTTAAVGILCTLDNILYPIVVTALIVFLNIVLKPISQKINKVRKYSNKENKNEVCVYKISLKCSDEQEIDIRSHLIKIIREKNEVLLHNLESNTDADGDKKIRAYISTVKENNDLVESIIAHIGKDEGLISAGWKIDS